MHAKPLLGAGSELPAINNRDYSEEVKGSKDENFDEKIAR